MSARVKKYRGEKIEVTFDPVRCIHSAECVRGLPAVFDTSRVPWIIPDAGSAEQVAEIVMRCPTGALHFSRVDGSHPETLPTENSALVAVNGPLYLRGNIELQNADGATIARDTRLALCRCGASENKPFCDNSHRKTRFTNTVAFDEAISQSPPEKGSVATLKIKASQNGPFEVEGELRLIGSDRKTGTVTTDTALCRCGHSQSKPFCDGSHERANFLSD